MLQVSFYDVTQINFRFRLLVTLSSVHGCDPVKFGADICIHSGVIDIFPKFKMAAAAILDLLGEPWDHPRRLVVRTLCKNFVMIG